MTNQVSQAKVYLDGREVLVRSEDLRLTPEVLIKLLGKNVRFQFELLRGALPVRELYFITRKGH